MGDPSRTGSSTGMYPFGEPSLDSTCLAPPQSSEIPFCGQIFLLTFLSGGYLINGVDLTAHLSIPLNCTWNSREKAKVNEFRENLKTIWKSSVPEFKKICESSVVDEVVREERDSETFLTPEKISDRISEWYIGRFLIARKWDMMKSGELFVNAMKWRKEDVS